MDARYHGSGRWTPRRGKRELRFEYFPTFDSHRAHEGEALVWDPVENRLRAAHPGEKYKFICEMRKKDGECLNIIYLVPNLRLMGTSKSIVPMPAITQVAFF